MNFCEHCSIRRSMAKPIIVTDNIFQLKINNCSHKNYLILTKSQKMRVKCISVLVVLRNYKWHSRKKFLKFQNNIFRRSYSVLKCKLSTTSMLFYEYTNTKVSPTRWPNNLFVTSIAKCYVKSDFFISVNQKKKQRCEYLC